MKYAVNSDKMKEIDNYTRDVIKIPSQVLMERAALEVVRVMKEKLQTTDRVLAVCGPGNNGGDGIAVGRILHLQGYQVAILLVGEEEGGSNLFREQLEIARNLGITIENNNKLHEYNIIIDAIFGVGLSRDITGKFEETIRDINRNDNMIYAVDIPTGISADTGKVMNIAVRADRTIAFGCQKQGMLVYPGAYYAGEVTVVDIGFPQSAIDRAKPDTFYYDSIDLCKLPERFSHSNKGTYGKVLVIAGSKGMSGAAYLSAKAAYRTGAGIVKILTSRKNRNILQTSLPEALFAAYDADDYGKEEQNRNLIDMIGWASVIVIGPGLGRSEIAENVLTLVLEHTTAPIVVDADALNMLSSRMDRMNREAGDRLGILAGMLPEDTVLTPHLMEFSRLTGIPVTDIADNIIDTATQCSYNNKLIYVLKDARTIVTKEGRKYINLSGNNGMATAGSGDVLSGIIAALISQGLYPYDASCIGVYIHGLAGDIAAGKKGTYSLMSGDIADAIEEVLHA